MKFIEAVESYQRQKELLSIIQSNLKVGNPIVNPSGRYMNVFEMVQLESKVHSEIKKLESIVIDYQGPLMRSD